MNEVHDRSTQAGPPPLPEALRRNLESFRARMRRAKLFEAACVVALALVGSYVVVAVVDRFFDTSAVVRACLLGVALLFAAVVIPRAISRWYLRHRDLRRVASEITTRDAALGDRLLGVIDLTRDPEEHRRSPDLVRAAIRQCERDLGTKNFGHALPKSRHRTFAALLAGPALAALGFAVLFPAAAGNAAARWALPFADIERYTFARLDDVHGAWYVPIQEPRQVRVVLASDTRRWPSDAQLRLRHATVNAELRNDAYTLELPPLSHDQSALLVVGDVRRAIDLLPRERADVVGATARVELPEYLELDTELARDVRGGSLACVEGSRVTVDFELSRALRTAAAIGMPAAEAATAEEGAPLASHVDGAMITVDAIDFATERDALAMSVDWVDELGLEGPAPFRLAVRPHPDEAPVVAVSGLEREVIVLDSVAVTFQVIATDDFGVRRAGLEWREALPYAIEGPDAALEALLDGREVLGDKVIAAGSADAGRLEALATLRPTDVGLTSGWYEIVAWATDALPGRARARSAPVTVQVMSSDEHMQWVTSRLERWSQRAAEVRDREMELLAQNRALHDLSNEEFAQPGTRSRIEAQARAERGNRARLRGLVGEGRAMLDEAARNPEFGSNAIDDWKQSMDKLQSIAEGQMTSVAELLEKAAREQDMPDETPSSSSPSGPPPPMVGEDRGSLASGAQPEEEEAEESDAKPSEIPATPVIQDLESALAQNEMPDEEPEPQPEDEVESDDEPRPTPLGLVSTTLGAAAAAETEDDTPPKNPNAEEPETRRKRTLAEAIAEQEALIEEFNDIAGEFKEVLAALENSTFVRRLKAASRAQEQSARDLDTSVRIGFGSMVATANEDVAAVAVSVSDRTQTELPKLRDLHGDLDAYFDRLRTKASDDLPKFKRILDEWSDLRPTMLADRLVDDARSGRPGDAQMSAGFLADTLDRWGEELVGPG